jgi:hypothetical protein
MLPPVYGIQSRDAGYNSLPRHTPCRRTPRTFLKCEPMQLSHVAAFWLRLAGNILLDLFLHVHMFCFPVERTRLYDV